MLVFLQNFLFQKEGLEFLVYFLEVSVGKVRVFAITNPLFPSRVKPLRDGFASRASFCSGTYNHLPNKVI